MFEAFVAAFSASFWKVFGPFGSFVVGAVLAYLGCVGAKFAHLELCWGYGCVIFMMSPSFPNFAYRKALPSGLRVVCLNCLSKICLSSTSLLWPASFTFRACSLPPVAYKSVGGQLRPSKGRVAAMLGFM